MNITAITRFKHGDVYQLLKKLGWKQSDLAKKTGLHPSSIGGIINLKRRPTLEMARKIQNAFGEAGEFLDILQHWPELFDGNGKSFCIEQTRDIDVLSLQENPEILQLPGCDTTGASEFMEQVKYHIQKLTPHNQKLATAMFVEEMSDQEAKERFGLNPEAANAMRNRLQRKLKRLIALEENEDPQHNRFKAMLGIKG